MKKNTFKENINALSKISSKIPKTINEAISFQSLENEENDMIDDEPVSNNQEAPINIQKNNSTSNVDANNVETFINETRKKSLTIMAKLAEDPENPIYDIAKRIWQICDKAYNDQKEGNGLQKQEQLHNQQNRM